MTNNNEMLEHMKRNWKWPAYSTRAIRAIAYAHGISTYSEEDASEIIERLETERARLDACIEEMKRGSS